LELAADTYVWKLQHMQNKVLHTTANLPRPTPTHEIHVAFKILYVYDFIKKHDTGSKQKSSKIMKM
jgi:hypothetical protein